MHDQRAALSLFSRTLVKLIWYSVTLLQILDYASLFFSGPQLLQRSISDSFTYTIVF